MGESGIPVYMSECAADIPRGRNTSPLLMNFENVAVETMIPIRKAWLWWCKSHCEKTKVFA